MVKEPMDELLKEALKADKIPSEELNASILAQIEGKTVVKRKSLFPRIIVVAASVLLVVTAFGGTLFREHVEAMMEHLFGSITETYVTGDVQKKELAEEEVYRINQLINRQGIGIALEEVLVDANKVAYCLKIHSDEQWGVPLEHSGADCHVYINGELLSGQPVSLGWTADGHTETWVEEVSLNPGMELNGNVEVAVCIDKVHTVPETNDHWNFKTVVNVNTANRHTMRDLTTTEMKLKNGDLLILHKVIATSTDCKLYFTYRPATNKKDFDIHFEGVDNLGNRITDSGYQLKKIKGKKKYHLVVTVDGALKHNVNKLVLNPYQLDKTSYEYYPVGEAFSVTLC